MKSSDLRKKFLEFFKKRGHKVVPSSSLIPSDDSVLLTTAGMQQFVPYFSGRKDIVVDFGNRHLCSVQKCFRTVDIENVGDDTHHTLFEMLGNWSIGQDEKGYFKEGAIKLALEFLVNELGLEKEKFSVTVFEGDKEIEKDEEAIKLWWENGISKDKIFEFSAEDNFWGPTAETGPCGPCSEIHYDRGREHGCGSEKCGPNCERCKRFVEVWNLVFMEYNKNADGLFIKLPQSNIDTGIGFERLLSILNNTNSAYETDLFSDIIKKIEELSGKKYEENKKEFRIIADHIRASVFLISDGVVPSNTGKGYILRRLLRRIIRYGKFINLDNYLENLAETVVKIYSEAYPELEKNKSVILEEITKEEEKFEKTLETGMREFEKVCSRGGVTGDEAFHLYDTYGFPFELTEELAKEREIFVDKEGFSEAFKKHQELSRTASAGMFKGGLADAGETAVKYHTATHLLLAALRQVLGEDILQKGSNITAERLRFDFNYSQKLTSEQIQEVERLVNEKIQKGIEVEMIEMKKDEALKLAKVSFDPAKYGDIVKVYKIGDFSIELCGGPHAKNTKELGEFKITKEESSSSGVRRIKAVLFSEGKQKN